jgi:hypothetical protein
MWEAFLGSPGKVFHGKKIAFSMQTECLNISLVRNTFGAYLQRPDRHLVNSAEDVRITMMKCRSIELWSGV